MLTRHSVNAVYDLAQQVTENNISLVPKDESPLTALLNACISPSIASGQQIAYSNSDGDAATPQTFIGASTLKNSEGASEHDLVMDELIESVTEAVSNNLNWARNEVGPMVELVHENAQKAIEDAAISGVQPYTLIPYFYADLWDRDEVVTMAERYSVIPRQPISLSAAIPLPENKSIRDVLVTGIPGVDDGITQLIDRLGEARVTAVYNSVFGRTRAAQLDLQLTMNWDEIDSALLIMLLGNQLAQHVPAGINMSLDAFNSYMASITAQAGAQVGRILSRRQNYIANKIMVLQRPSNFSNTGNLIVNGDVYNDWLGDGGSPEILMGAVIAGRSENYKGLLDEQALNLRSYATVSNSLKSELQYAKFNALLKSYRASMTQIINNMEEADLPVPKSVLFANLSYRLSKIHMDDVGDLEIPSRKIVCRTLWHHTDVEKYLEAIEAAAAAHPELDVREAALLGAIDVAVEWLMGQLTLVPAQ
jgi:hypothetical protein